MSHFLYLARHEAKAFILIQFEQGAYRNGHKYAGCRRNTACSGAGVARSSVEHTPSERPLESFTLQQQRPIIPVRNDVKKSCAEGALLRILLWKIPSCGTD